MTPAAIPGILSAVLRHAAAVMTLLVVLTAAGWGCESQTKPPPAEDYTAMFNAGRYSDAYDAASKAAGSLRGGRHDSAALIAGQSAYRLGKLPDAMRWLTPLLESSSTTISGTAAATLGSIAKERGENTRAAGLFLTAGQRLTGDNAARALMYAGDCKKALGSREEADALYAAARDKVESDVTLRVQIGDRLAGMPVDRPAAGPPIAAGEWTVQAGAFASRAAADSLAASLSRHGPTRIVPLVNGGKTLYAVRVGRYRTKAEADRVRGAIGKGAAVRSTAGE